jgi:DNA-binding NarL/FixJ family response regulator
MSNQAHIRILNVDDHPLLNEGIAAIINDQPDMQLVAQASSGREAIEKFRGNHPDVTLMDLRLPDMSGIDTMIAIRTEFPEARIIILTTVEGDVEIKRALEAGAQGYMLKRIPSEVAARLAEHLGEENLTSREIEVLRYAAEGNRNRDIGEKLFISEETVKVHIKHIMEKLAASDRTQAVSIALRRGIIELGPDQSDRQSSHQSHHKKAGYP